MFAPELLACLASDCLGIFDCPATYRLYRVCTCPDAAAPLSSTSLGGVVSCPPYCPGVTVPATGSGGLYYAAPCTSVGTDGASSWYGGGDHCQPCKCQCTIGGSRWLFESAPCAAGQCSILDVCHWQVPMAWCAPVEIGRGRSLGFGSAMR